VSRASRKPSTRSLTGRGLGIALTQEKDGHRSP
jgi:hypothetical protein